MSNAYQVPAAPHECELEVKKSRFIARAARVANRKEAMAFLAQVKRAYPDARHHCWAYRLGNPHSAAGAAANDDGEPAGTAGKPILNVIQHKPIGDVMVVVVRYFGGIKLGAGGLVRAYSSAAEAVLSALPLVSIEPTVHQRVECGFAQEQPLRHWALQHEAQVVQAVYAEQVCLELVLPVKALGSLTSLCRSFGARLYPSEP
jgi:uncharacterized YigZ family protein